MSQHSPFDPPSFGPVVQNPNWHSQMPPASAPINPYAPPAATFASSPLVQSPPIPGGVWRQGKLLVMHKRAQLPPICIKSNQPSSQWLKRNLAWHEPWIVITVLAGLLIYVILALILTKRATIHVGLTDEWMARRRVRMIACWLLGLAFLAMIPAGIALFVNTNEPGWMFLMLIGFIGSLVVLVVAQYLVGLVSAQRISDEYVWLKGINRGFLDRLPEFPYRV